MLQPTWKKAIAAIITLLVPFTFALSYQSDNISAVTAEQVNAEKNEAAKQPELDKEKIEQLTA
ncbi:hypothetical protein, partial [Terribacillus saccharophilus]